MAKARKAKLKVFRTPIGFHDAYVAAPSQKAALEAWGADSNLFAQGIAEAVTDPELMEEPLERPGEVVKRLRGSESEQIAALAREKAEGKGGSRIESGTTNGKSTKQNPAKSKPAKAKRERPPRPSRAKFDQAEAALERAEKRQRGELSELDREIAALERKRRDLQRRHERERDSLAEKRDRARASYERALRSWERS